MEAKIDTINHLKFTVDMAMGTDLMQCPNCAKHLKPAEVAQHCEEETERLKYMQMEADALTAKNDCLAAESEAGTNENEERRKPWSVFQKVQHNRYSRLKQRTRKRPMSVVTSIPERACPICNRNFSQDDIEQHVEDCLKRSKILNGQNGNNSSDEDEGSEEYEEYEWAGQKRIRVSSLLQGGYAAHGIGQVITNGNGNPRQEGNQTDEEEDLNVDEDDTHIYGPPQYAENDIISPDMECNDDNTDENVTSYMRKLITGSTDSANVEDRVKVKQSKNETTIDAEASEATTSSNASLFGNHIKKDNTKSVYEHIIRSLKAKLRLFENQQFNKYKCLICLDEYRNPAISVSCWHVHCEDCWLRSLGTRKLCPQCNLITTPKDLRRIYM